MEKFEWIKLWIYLCKILLPNNHVTISGSNPIKQTQKPQKKKSKILIL